MDSIQALNNFWNSFDIPAYDVSTVPDDAKMPYITYEIREDFIGANVATTSSIWYRDYSWKAITEKMKDIKSALGIGGKLIRYTNGAVWVKPAEPFAQRMQDPDDAVRRYVINTYYEFLEGE